MNTLTALSGFALVLTACAMPFDLLGEPLFTNPTLIIICQPVDAPVNGRVYCEYNPENMTCTASCENGFVADPNVMFRTLTCTYQMPFPTGSAFGACRMAVPTLAPTLQPSVTDSPVVGPVVHAGRCVHNVMECGTEEGNFQACTDCSKFVTCSVNGASLMDCPVGLQWDDNVKRCERHSDTCL